MLPPCKIAKWLFLHCSNKDLKPLWFHERKISVFSKDFFFAKLHVHKSNSAVLKHLLLKGILILHNIFINKILLGINQ